MIDQRILIDAPSESVWRVLSDPDCLADWHAGYAAVSVLTTLGTGVGARRRCTPVSGKDVIEEITAWVDGLGYEYTLVEGGPFRSFQARIRLQAGPDGTFVQWTITYRRKGLFGGLRDQFGGKRTLARQMAESLLALRRQVDALGTRMEEAEREKVAIRERLNADERASYQRRHAPPPGLDLGFGDSARPPTPPDALPAVEVAGAPPVPPAPVPSFVADLTAGSDEPDYDPNADTKPRPPEGLREAIAAQRAQAGEMPPEDAQFARPAAAPDLATDPRHDTDASRTTPPRGIPSIQPPAPEQIAPPPPPAPEMLKPPPAATESTKETPPRGIPSVQPPVDSAPPPDTPFQTPKTDTGEISIWDVFGVRRPSEQDTDALDDLLKAVETKKRRAARRAHGTRTGRVFRVRHLDGVWGLRLRLALKAAGVRLRVRLDTGEE